HEVSTGYCTDRCWAGSYSLVQPSKGIANAGRTAGFTGSLELRDDHAVGKAGRTRWERIFYAERSGRVRAADTQTQQHGPACWSGGRRCPASLQRFLVGSRNANCQDAAYVPNHRSSRWEDSVADCGCQRKAKGTAKREPWA